MSELKPVEITLQILGNLNLECTGNRNEFARRLRITPRHLTQYLRKIEQVQNIKIAFCRKRCTYYVAQNQQHKFPPPPYLE